jgi:putative ATP-dependent endonuclease of OLD family
MKVSRAHIENFRLLQNAVIALDGESTMIVGRNNSGKTSVVEMFRKFTKADPSAFVFDDVSLDVHSKFDEAHAAYLRWVSATEAGNAEAIEAESIAVCDLPAISLTLTITYEESDDLAAIAPIIMDLDPDRFDATIIYRTGVKDPFALFEAYEAAAAKRATDLTTFLRKQFPRFTSSVIEAVDASDLTNRKPLSDADVKRLLSVRFIYAQNQMDDLSSDSGHRLSKGFEEFYRSNESDGGAADAIALLLEQAGQDLDGKYEQLFGSIFADLEVFGVGRMPGLPKLSVVSELQAINVLKGSTHLYYSDAGATKRLPEGHNGLGYSKLIFTILQLIAFYEELVRLKPQPPIQLIFIEEPEVHLHPQMQYVFVKSIRQFVNGKSDWNAQTIITTHSSHMIAESGFDCIRYFDNSVSPLSVRDLSEFRKEECKTAAGKAAVSFLEQYMVLNRCDMFFADKLILIEGTVERLLLPEMIKTTAPELAHQYVSVIEVGGAYAHLFRKIVEFLNVQTLVITDIDSIDPADQRRAKQVAPGLATSNQTLEKWLPGKSAIDELLAADNVAKTAGRVRVAYQLPETDASATGRSFEEAFILANGETLSATPSFASHRLFERSDGERLTALEITTDSYSIASRISKKTDFAFDILQMSDWTVPLYIREGLEWLNTTP